jgi:anti-sigma-K factor RskA
MDGLTPRDGRPHRAEHGAGWESPRTWRVLTVVFTVAAAGSLVLVIADLLVGRPAAGDVFIAALNSLAAAVLWHRFARAGRDRARRGNPEGEGI